MSTIHCRANRGASFLELTGAIAILTVGITTIALLAIHSIRQNGNARALIEAQLIAEAELERLSNQGCSTSSVPVCANITALDNTSYSRYYTPTGQISPVPVATPGDREYRVAIDVDAPGFFEGTERGQPALDRPLAPTGTANIFNVRVSVSWTSAHRPGMQAIALQTRMAP